MAVLSRLKEGGFIQINEHKAERTQSFCNATNGWLRPAAEKLSSKPTPLDRKSMSAAKRYLVGRLSEVKDANTKRFIVSLDRSINNDELVQAMIHTLMYLQSELVSADCSDVASQLSQMVPTKYWEQIQSDLSLNPNSCC